VPAKRKLRKVVDEVSPVRCVSGPGLIREEVWHDATGEVVRYNLAFINHFLTNRDSGRVLGYDNQHSHHHRHFKGTVENFAFVSYDETLDRFRDEVIVLRTEKL